MATVVFGAILVALLVALAAIDLQRMILPDPLNALLAAAGLGHAFWFEQLPEAMLGAVFAGFLLWAVAAGYRRWRAVEGLGLGDVKLAAAGATWTGVAGVGPMLLAATASCALVLLASAAREGRIDARQRFPFGPFLAFGVFAAWLLTQAT